MKISFVIPCYCSELTISHVVNDIQFIMQTLSSYTYEIILVNDSSPDNTLQEIKKLCFQSEKIIGISMAKNFGQHAALMAGYQFVSGDIIVCLDDDGQTPAKEVGKLIQKIEDGYDVVYAEYEHKKHSLFRNLGSSINKKMTESMLDKPKGLYISSYFAARRFVIDEMIQYKNPYPYVIGLVLRTTKNICNVKVTHQERLSGQSGYSFRKLISLWLNGFTSFSVKPLRTATYTGIIIAVMGLIYTIWILLHKFLEPAVPIGWSSTISAVLLIGGVILFELGMIGEYVGRIYICLNKSPQYVIKELINPNTIESEN